MRLRSPELQLRIAPGVRRKWTEHSADFCPALMPGRRVAGSVKRSKVVDHPDVGRAAVIWLATPTLTTPSWLCAAPTVGRLHSGFEQRYPARFASVSIVRSVKSSLTFRPLSEDQSGPCSPPLATSGPRTAGQARGEYPAARCARARIQGPVCSWCCAPRAHP